ncbi:MAG TPA: S1 RNA-binding domain-containing protein, partial [Candidatus Kapabacteria bacterium]|nr:S1 RNA-binding domain-containing protein [Candidatus Kapabacteria bacterium]
MLDVESKPVLSGTANVTSQGSHGVINQVSDDEFTRLIMLYEGTLGTIHENEVIQGKVVSINGDDVSIDIGFKSEGIVNRSEFGNLPDLKPGDSVEVFLEKIEDKDGRPQLSRKRADFLRTWERLNNAFTTQEILQVKCLRRIKGGLVVDLLGIEAFLPGSQIDVRPVRDFDAYIDKMLDVRLVKITNPTENVIVSHKILLEEHLNEQRKVILDKLERGQILEGTV